MLLFSPSVVSDSLRPQGLRLPLSITISRSLLKLMSIELVMPSNHLILCHPCLLLPSIFPSIRVFSNESALRISEGMHSSRLTRPQSPLFTFMPPSTTGPSPPLHHQWGEVTGVQIAGTGKEGFINQPDQQGLPLWLSW